MNRLLLILILSFSLQVFLYAQKPGSGFALNFNGGSNYTDCGKLNLGTSDFSVECWMRLTNASILRGVMGSWVSAPQPWPSYFYIIYGMLSPNTLTAAFHTSGYQFNSYASYSSNLLNAWHHIAVTYRRNGYMTLYVDGIARDSTDISSYAGQSIDNPTPGVNYQIGSAGSQNSFFMGQLDEVRIWTKVLSVKEIRSRMCKKLKGNEPGLKAYWRMDEGNGNTIFDSTISGYNGTLY